jgi:hypothetical protein
VLPLGFLLILWANSGPILNGPALRQEMESSHISNSFDQPSLTASNNLFIGENKSEAFLSRLTGNSL